MLLKESKHKRYRILIKPKSKFVFLLYKGLKIIPVINKIDLQSAQIDSVEYQIVNTLKLDDKDIICISAKNNVNVDKLFEKIISYLPPPNVNTQSPEPK